MYEHAQKNTTENHVYMSFTLFVSELAKIKNRVLRIRERCRVRGLVKQVVVDK